MKLTDRINAGMHSLFAWRLRETYRRQMKGFEKRHPESFARVSPELKASYSELWSRLIPNPYDGWLRLLVKLSGKNDSRFVPADAYYSVIERCLNDCNTANGGIDDKNLMSLYAPKKYLPKVVLRYVRGVFLDEDFRGLSHEEADAILKRYPNDVIGKGASDTSGGKSVKLFRPGELTADCIERNYMAYIVQERVVQEPKVSAFNPDSVNTCRIVTFRRPWSGKISVQCAMLRLGCGGDIVDNISSGGCCVDVAMDGSLAESGVTPDFGRLSEHTKSHLKFDGFVVPYFREMCAAACEVAARVPDYNILGFDMVARENGTPCIIEVNTTSIASIMIQMGHPLFGDETDQVIDWCVKNRRLDTFKHIRTFY